MTDEHVQEQRWPDDAIKVKRAWYNPLSKSVMMLLPGGDTLVMTIGPAGRVRTATAFARALELETAAAVEAEDEAIDAALDGEPCTRDGEVPISLARALMGLDPRDREIAMEDPKVQADLRVLREAGPTLRSVGAPISDLLKVHDHLVVESPNNREEELDSYMASLHPGKINPPQAHPASRAHAHVQAGSKPGGRAVTPPRSDAGPDGKARRQAGLYLQPPDAESLDGLPERRSIVAIDADGEWFRIRVEEDGRLHINYVKQPGHSLVVVPVVSGEVVIQAVQR